MKRYKKNRLMMATKAIHQLGDISSEEPKLCIVYGEDEKDFIGQWMTGLGFVDVKFLKETTRELTEDEREKLKGTKIRIGGRTIMRF